MERKACSKPNRDNSDTVKNNNVIIDDSLNTVARDSERKASSVTNRDNSDGENNITVNIDDGMKACSTQNCVNSDAGNGIVPDDVGISDYLDTEKKEDSIGSTMMDEGKTSDCADSKRNVCTSTPNRDNFDVENTIVHNNMEMSDTGDDQSEIIFQLKISGQICDDLNGEKPEHSIFEKARVTKNSTSNAEASERTVDNSEVEKKEPEIECVVATNPDKKSMEPDSSQNDHDSLQKERNSNISIEVDANDANEKSGETGEEGKTSDSVKKDNNAHISEEVDAMNGNRNSLEHHDEPKSHDLLKDDKNGNANDKVDDTNQVENSVGKKQQNLVVTEISDNGKVNDFMINISGSDEDKEQAELSMNVMEIITALSRSESIEKLLYEKGEDDSDGKNKMCEKDTKSNEEDESTKDVCNNDLTESIMTKMADMKELDSVKSMELYRLRGNKFPVSATTETESEDEEIIIVQNNKRKKRKKEM